MWTTYLRLKNYFEILCSGISPDKRQDQDKSLRQKAIMLDEMVFAKIGNTSSLCVLRGFKNQRVQNYTEKPSQFTFPQSKQICRT